VSSTPDRRDLGTGAPDDPLLEWRAILPGALTGLLVLVVASVTDAILDRNLADYDDSGWRYVLFVVVLIGYLSAGFIAGRRAPGGALSNGALAGTVTFVIWIPVRILIWIARDEHEALFTGTDPVFKPGQIFGHIVIASALGMLGGILGAHLVAKRAG
jgi:putative membrane protein (TIGR04086 family)